VTDELRDEVKAWIEKVSAIAETRSLILYGEQQLREHGRLDFESEGDADWLKDLHVLDLDEVRLCLDRVKASVRELERLWEQAMLRDIQANGAVVLGETGYYAGTETQSKLVNPQGLVDWLFETGGLPAVKAVVGVSERNVRTTALAGVAVDNGFDPQTVRDSFFVSTARGDGGKVLKKVPASKAKWVAERKHGERR